MTTLVNYLRQYQAYHQKPFTVYTHFIGVPFVMFSVMLILSWFNLSMIGVFSMNLLWPVLVGLFLYYWRLDKTLAIAMFLILCALAWLIDRLIHTGFSLQSLYLFLFFFIVGWVFQFLGHAVERRKPAFLDSLHQLLIGPLFVLAEVFFMLGLKKELRQLVQQANYSEGR